MILLTSILWWSKYLMFDWHTYLVHDNSSRIMSDMYSTWTCHYCKILLLILLLCVAFLLSKILWMFARLNCHRCSLVFVCIFCSVPTVLPFKIKMLWTWLLSSDFTLKLLDHFWTLDNLIWKKAKFLFF